jgi:hypothetical protein
MNFLQQLLKSRNPQQMLLNMMTPQQRMMAQAFLSNPNREQALKELMAQNNVSQQQVDSLKNLLNN